MMRILAAALLAAAALVQPAHADFRFDSTAGPAPAATVAAFVAGRSWVWSSKAGKGAAFHADGTFVAIGGHDAVLIGRGTWKAMRGKLCWDAEWTGRSAVSKRPFCWEMIAGPGRDGKKLYKDALGMKGVADKAFFWISRDGEVWAPFVEGDRYSAPAARALARWGKS